MVGGAGGIRGWLGLRVEGGAEGRGLHKGKPSARLKDYVRERRS